MALRARVLPRGFGGGTNRIFNKLALVKLNKQMLVGAYQNLLTNLFSEN